MLALSNGFLFLSHSPHVCRRKREGGEEKQLWRERAIFVCFFIFAHSSSLRGRFMSDAFPSLLSVCLSDGTTPSLFQGDCGLIRHSALKMNAIFVDEEVCRQSSTCVLVVAPPLPATPLLPSRPLFVAGDLLSSSSFILFLSSVRHTFLLFAALRRRVS